MIRSCGPDDFVAIHHIINSAAAAYQGVIPADCWHEPYMAESELRAEIAAGVLFSGWEVGGVLLGVMGLQRVLDVTLIRHAYVRPDAQGRGVGSALLTAYQSSAPGRLLVGTWADAMWAIRFYERHGFRLLTPSDTERMLQTYWTVSTRQREVSVVLERVS